MARPLGIVLFGGNGRMGRETGTLIARDARFRLVKSVGRENFQELGPALRAAGAAIDFSSPAGTLFCAGKAATERVPLVVATTGFSKAQTARLKTFSRRIPLLLAPNCSLGMNLLYELVRRAAASLPGYDAGVCETHHTRKKDAPSGSAKRLAAALADGDKRHAGVRPVSLRLGDVVGEHTVFLAGPEETLEFTHRAGARALFARGALTAALWLRGRKPGLYSMRDVLAL